MSVSVTSLLLNSLPLLDIIDFCARFRHCLAEPRLASFARPALLLVNLTARDYPNIHMRHDERGRMPAFSGGQSVCLFAISLSVYALENTQRRARKRRARKLTASGSQAAAVSLLIDWLETASGTVWRFSNGCFSWRCSVCPDVAEL